MQERLAGAPHILSLFDLFIGPVYLVLILIWLFFWGRKNYKQTPLRKYILPAFILKSFCCIILALLYEYYYGYGDPHNYFKGATEIWNAAKSNIWYAAELIFKPVSECSPAAQEFAFHIMGPESYPYAVIYMFKFSGAIGLFCFGSYLPIALVFTLFSFLGGWRIFVIFCSEFPQHSKKIAISCLFAPSVLFWGTNILKDPLCIFGLGLCFTSFYSFIKHTFKLKNFLELVVGSLLILSLKSYIFYFFLIPACYIIYKNFLKKIQQPFIKIVVKILNVFIIIFALIFYINKREVIGNMILESFFERIEIVQNYQKEMGGSAYVINNTNDFSIIGIIKTYFNSLNVALFRPYPWEAGNLIVFFNSIESILVLLITLYLLIKCRITAFFSFAKQNSILSFALLFTLLLAPVAGLISFNFGTLVRYKVPCIPFFYTYLVLLYEHINNHHNNFSKKNL